jgi:hypothetical protein
MVDRLVVVPHDTNAGAQAVQLLDHGRLRASSGSRSASSSIEPLRSANSTVTRLRSPSRAVLEVRIFSARCFGVYASGDGN